MEIQPLTLSPQKLIDFLERVTPRAAANGKKNLAAPAKTAISKMDWKPYAKKVIVLVGDSPPAKRRLRSAAGARSVSSRVRTAPSTRLTSPPKSTSASSANSGSRCIARSRPRSRRCRSSISRPALHIRCSLTRVAVRCAVLSKDSHINQQVLMLAFGEQWQSQVCRIRAEESVPAGGGSGSEYRRSTAPASVKSGKEETADENAIT